MPPGSPLLLIYRDKPCVVIGRNQNPWKESNLEALRAAKIPFVRRRSGGGTVYHDLGNTNFSLHMPRASFERQKGSGLAVDALKRMGIAEAWVNERNDVCVGSFKVSGSAYKIINARAYHHGTMLIDSRIDQLRDVLHNTKDTMVGRSVASVRSPVRNLSAVNPAVTHEQFCNAIVEAFVEQYSVNDKVVHIGEEDLKAQKYAAERAFVENSIIELESWEWKYGQTLEFTHSISGNIEGRSMHAEIKAKHGIITECGISYDASQSPDENVSLSSLSSRLIGKRYGFLDLDDIADGQPERKVLQWLQNEM